LTEDARKSNDRFNRFDELLNFLIDAPLAQDVLINVSSGELSLFPDLIETAYNKLKKIERYKDTSVKFGLYTNGSNIEAILDLLDRGILDPKYTSMSWDGIFGSTIRESKSSKYNDSLFNKAIESIGRSKYKDDILIRSALTSTLLLHQKQSIEYLIDCGCSNWEYYFLIDNDEYRDPIFLDIFEKELNSLYKYNGNGINIFNINSMLEFYSTSTAKKRLWCRSLYNSIEIDVYGKILPCGSYSNGYKYKPPSIDFDDISQKYDPAKIERINIDNCIKCHQCNHANCGNLHCIECARLIPYRTGDIFEYKASQPCKIRNIERKLYYGE
jgi:hypothetical protein